MSTNDGVNKQHPVSDLENWNTDRTVDPITMVRGVLFKTSGGSWVNAYGQSDGSLNVNTELSYYTVRVSATSAYEYTGLANPGYATSSSVWLIMRETLADSTLLYADGDSNFDNAWTSLSAISFS